MLLFTRTPSLARACARACAPTPSAHVPARATSASDSAVHCGCRCRSCRPMSIMPSLSKGSDLVTPHALSSSLTPDRRQNASRIPCSQSDVSFDHGRLAQRQRMEDKAASSGGSHNGTDPEDRGETWFVLKRPRRDTNGGRETEVSKQQWRRGCYCCSLNKSRRISKGGLFVFMCQSRGKMHCANVRAAAQACTSEVKDILVCFWLVFCSNQAAAAVAPSGLRIQGQTFTRRLKHVTESGSSNVHWAAHHRIISWPAVVNTHRSRTPFSRRAKHTPALTALNLSSMHAPPSVRPK